MIQSIDSFVLLFIFYLTMKQEDLNIELLKKLVRENPNNYSLGEIIRRLVNSVENGKYTKSSGKVDDKV